MTCWDPRNFVSDTLYHVHLNICIELDKAPVELCEGYKFSWMSKLKQISQN